MINVNNNQLDKYFDFFKEWMKKENPKAGFNSSKHPFILETETVYKKEVKKEALDALRTPPLKPELIGTGKIIDRIVAAINVDENLISTEWRSKDNEIKFKDKASKKELVEYEQFLYEFIKKSDNKKDKYFFDRFVDYKKTLRYIAYFFYIKDDSQKKYMPILQDTFDKVFKVLDIDLKTSGNWDWEVYLNYNNVLEQVRVYLENKMNEKITLVDAHSFLYMMSYSEFAPNYFPKKKKAIKQNDEKEVENKSAIIEVEPQIEILEQPTTKILDNDEINKFSVDNLSDFKTFIDTFDNSEPKVKQIITNKIERGNFANKVKKFVGYKCLLCELLFNETHSFIKPNGEMYVEVHHVEPVSELKKGSLALSNLITLCANHHKQMHFGNVKYEIKEKSFIFTIDNNEIEIEKIDLSKVND